MRVVVVAIALLALLLGTGPASADDASATAEANKKAAARAKALKPYAGKLVISPDAPPTAGDEIPGYLKGNLSPDAGYELIKGPPWRFHVTAVLAAPAKTVTLLIADKADKKLTPLLSANITLTNDRKLVLAQAEATVAAGFAANTIYVVRLMVGKKLLAKSELLLRD